MRVCTRRGPSQVRKASHCQVTCTPSKPAKQASIKICIECLRATATKHSSYQPQRVRRGVRSDRARCKMVGAQKKAVSCLIAVSYATWWGQAVKLNHEKTLQKDNIGKWKTMTILENNFVWEQRDQRLDDFPLMNSLWPTFVISAGYLYTSGIVMGMCNWALNRQNLKHN